MSLLFLFVSDGLRRPGSTGAVSFIIRPFGCLCQVLFLHAIVVGTGMLTALVRSIPVRGVSGDGGWQSV